MYFFSILLISCKINRAGNYYSHLTNEETEAQSLAKQGHIIKCRTRTQASHDPFLFMWHHAAAR